MIEPPLRIPHVDGAPLSANFRLTLYLVLAARRWRSLLDEQLRAIGQSAARMEALWAIAYSPPLSPQIEIARVIGIEGATFTRMLDTLEAEKLVERLAYPSDRRSKHLRLTEDGRKALAEITDVAAALRSTMLEGIDPAQLAGANAFLSMLLDRFEGVQPAGA